MMRMRSVRQVGYPYLLLAPALLVLAVVALYPAVSTIHTSLYNRSLILPGARWLGLGNFDRLLHDPLFWNAWKNTMYFTILTVVFETVIGMGIALVLNRDFRGRGVVRAAVLIPWAIPTVVSSRLWELIFSTDYGIANYLLQGAHLVAGQVNWLGSTKLALNAACVVDVWKTTPFMALLLMAGLQTVPSELYEAAAMDGASVVRRFTQITLPVVSPILLVAMLLRMLDAFRVFDVIYVMTGGGPANSTEVMSTLTYKVLFSATQFGYGSALAATMFVSMLLISAAYLIFLRTRLEVA